MAHEQEKQIIKSLQTRVKNLATERDKLRTLKDEIEEYGTAVDEAIESLERAISASANWSTFHAGALADNFLVFRSPDMTLKVVIPDRDLRWDMYCEALKCKLLPESKISIEWKGELHQFDYKEYESTSAIIKERRQ